MTLSRYRHSAGLGALLPAGSTRVVFPEGAHPHEASEAEDARKRHEAQLARRDARRVAFRHS